MNPYSQEYTGQTERLHTAYAPIAFAPERRAGLALAVIGALAVLMLLLILARLPEPMPATSAAPIGGYHYEDNSINVCVLAYCPR
jgi:hypothetical protein